MVLLFLILILGLFCNIPINAQDTIIYPYQITGVIYDTSGQPLPGVSILSPGDGNHQVSDINGEYYANIYSPSTPVLFSYYKYTDVLYCPDGSYKVDIVLQKIKGRWFKKTSKRITNIFRSKKSIHLQCK